MGTPIRLAIALALLTSEVSAQDTAPSRTTFVIGATGAAMIAPLDADHLLALGFAAGFERHLSRALTVRVATSAMRGGIGAGDDVAICRIGPTDGCLPRAYMPRWLVSTELTASMMLVPWFPLRLQGGIGVGAMGDAREPADGAPATHSGVETPGVLRAGFEIPVGSGTRSPRLIVTRAWFRPTPFSLRRLDALAILFPR